MSKTTKYSFDDVFTPMKPARLTFVEREPAGSLLAQELLIPGRQIILYGRSGAGKSTLLTYRLQELNQSSIVTMCMTWMTFEELLLDAFKQLNTVHAMADNSLPAPLASHFFAEWMGATQRVWILEDFHKLKPDVQKRLSHLMKTFVEMAGNYPTLKVILVGTTEHLEGATPDLRDQIATVYLASMTEREMAAIIQKGADLLNLQISQEICERIIHHADGMVALCHQFALNLCLHAEVYETQITSTVIDEPAYQKAAEVTPGTLI